MCADVQHSGLAEIRTGILPLNFVPTLCIVQASVRSSLVGLRLLLNFTACFACALAGASTRPFGSRQTHTWLTPVVPSHCNIPANEGKSYLSCDHLISFSMSTICESAPFGSGSKADTLPACSPTGAQSRHHPINSGIRIGSAKPDPKPSSTAYTISHFYLTFDTASCQEAYTRDRCTWYSSGEYFLKTMRRCSTLSPSRTYA